MQGSEFTTILPAANIRHPTFEVRVATDLLELEEVCQNGPLVSWDALMAADATSSFFQGPAWCMTWYRSYSDVFCPFVVIVTCEGNLVGIAPLAVERVTRRLTFAGDNMSDYRDVVALPFARKFIIEQLISIHRQGRFADPFVIGFTQPESPTVSILLSSDEWLNRIRVIVRNHACYRRLFDETSSGKELLLKSSVRRHLNYFKKQGEVQFQRITTIEEWDRVKHIFFEHHSLRQLSAGRHVSFTNHRKQTFYDKLFTEAPYLAHVSVLRVAGRLLAEHFGFAWNGMVYLGAPAFDVREEKHSPAQVLIAFLVQHAHKGGLRGMDFTIGESAFKSRFGNTRVSLPSAEIYSRAGPYYFRLLRTQFVDTAKRITFFFAGPDGWERVKSLLSSTSGRVRDKSNFHPKVPRLLYVASAADIPSSSLLLDEATCLRIDEIGDLLKGEMTEAHLSRHIKEAIERFKRGQTLHTVLSRGRLAFAAWSSWVENVPGRMESRVESKPSLRSVLITPLYHMHEDDDRDWMAEGMRGVIRNRMVAGAERFFLHCPSSNCHLSEAVGLLGFRCAKERWWARHLSALASTPSA